MMLADTELTIGVGVLASLLSVAFTLGGMRAFQARRARPEPPAASAPCQEHEKRLTVVETTLQVQVPALEKQIDQLGKDVRDGIQGVRERLDKALERDKHR